MGEFVVGEDLRENSALPLDAGASWAKAFGKRLLVLHGDGFAGQEAMDVLFDEIETPAKERYLQGIIETNIKAIKDHITKTKGIKEIEVESDSRPGSGAEVLLDQAADPDTELLVLGYNPKRTLREVFLGNVSEELIHKAKSSVMIVKNAKAKKPKNILVAYDFSHHCDQALEWANKIHEHFGSKTHLVNVVPCYYKGYRSPEAARGELNRKIEEMISENIAGFEKKLVAKAVELTNQGVDIEPVILIDKAGSISDRIVNYIEENDIDLALIGSHMRGRVKELFLGSVAHSLIKKSPCSILVAR